MKQPQTRTILLGLAISAVMFCTNGARVATALETKPDPFVTLVAQIRPAVLAVGTYHFKDTPTAQYFGTGFVVYDGNTLATNAHVIDAVRQAKRLEMLVVYPPDSRPMAGRRAVLLIEDTFHDIALLRFSGAPIPVLELDAKTDPQQGQAIAIIGYPIGTALGVVPAVHRGVIAAVVPAVRPLPTGVDLTPELKRAIQNPYNLYQLDLVALPGNSGSPMFDAHTGKVVGIINKTLAAKTREHMLANPSGIAYAVPVNWIEQLWERVQAELKNRQGQESRNNSGSPSASDAPAPAGD